MVKPAFGQPVDRATYEHTRNFFEGVVKLLHPFMPFISEEIWHSFKDRAEDDYLIVAPWPTGGAVDEQLLREGDLAFEVVSQIRNLRNTKQLSPKTPLVLQIKTPQQDKFAGFSQLIKKMANLAELNFVTAKPRGAAGFVIKGDEFFVPLTGEVDTAKEKEKLQKELDYTRGFLTSITKKLSNERFVNNAPEQVVANERQKQADAEAKIKALEQQLQNL